MQNVSGTTYQISPKDLKTIDEITKFLSKTVSVTIAENTKLRQDNAELQRDRDRLKAYVDRLQASNSSSSQCTVKG